MNPRPVAHLLALAMLVASFSSAHAQHASHDAQVRLPDAAGVRMVGAASGPSRATFARDAESTANLGDVGDGVVEPTLVHRFEDQQLDVAWRNRWSVHVVATPFAQVGTGESPILLIERFSVHRGASSGLVQNAVEGTGPSAGILAAWQPSTEVQRILFRFGRTGVLRSLGFLGAVTVWLRTAPNRPATTSRSSRTHGLHHDA